MKPSQTPSLGKLVANVIRTHNDIVDDPMNAYAEFTPSPDRYIERMVQNAGFKNVHHFRAAVVARTSARWAYINLPC